MMITPSPHLSLGGGHPNHRQTISDIPGTLDVISVISNPCRYQSRYDLYRPFERHMLDSRVRLTTVEMAFGDRPFEVTQSSNPRHLQLRSSSELWYKENLINLGVQTLPKDWAYVAWVDADIQFSRPDWVQETIHQLQHHPVVQLFSHPIDLGPQYEPMLDANTSALSWGYCKVQGLFRTHQAIRLPDEVELNPASSDVANVYTRMVAAPSPQPKEKWGKTGYFAHPGYGWAYTREAFEDLGGLFDLSLVGAGDTIMAAALTGDNVGIHTIPPSLQRYADIWKDRAEKYIRGDVGVVMGTILHYFHGPKSKRGYMDRWKIYFDTNFDPDLDFKRDSQGLLQLTDRSPKLRDMLRAYFRSRDEDSTVTS